MENPQIKYCTSCKKRGDLVQKTLVPKLKKAFPESDFIMQCLSFCGPGSRQPFVYVDQTLITAKTDEELIEKIKKHLEK
ncbi:hypothetical protein AwErysi_08230 [Erysipelotrichaceae bacterium]|nr:hypothetical protein AwErysi_08230 [Erysipelotrichaceae bacterium]